MAKNTDVLRFPLGTTIVDRHHVSWEQMHSIVGSCVRAHVTVGRVSGECLTVKIRLDEVRHDPVDNFEGETHFALINDSIQITENVFVDIVGYHKEKCQALLVLRRDK